MNCRRFLNLLTVAVTFIVIWGGGLLLAWLWHPTSSLSHLVSYIATMFALTGATVAIVCWVAISKDRGGSK